jgi:serine protease Do
MSRRLGGIFVIGVGSFLGGAAGLLGLAQLERLAIAQGTSQTQGQAAPIVTDLVAISDRFELVAGKVAPAVVYVEAKKPGEREGPVAAKPIEESGSGVITRLQGRKDYLVLTNNHVIASAPASQILIQVADGRILRPARVWSDPESDVAVLGIETNETLPTAPLGDSDRMRVGQWVLAMGSPFGLNQTVTHGILSARERGQISLGSTIRIKDFLQTDAAINPGSSGGPLVNLNGEVIGINTAIASPNGSNSGVAFSIPINLYRRVMHQLLEKGSVSRGYLGIQLSHTFEPADALKLGLNRAGGALIEVVYPDTPAAQAGLRVGDVILEADGSAIRNENQLINYISNCPAGKTINLSVWRDRRAFALSALLADWSRGQDRLKDGK